MQAGRANPRTVGAEAGVFIPEGVVLLRRRLAGCLSSRKKLKVVAEAFLEHLQEIHLLSLTQVGKIYSRASSSASSPFPSSPAISVFLSPV